MPPTPDLETLVTGRGLLEGPRVDAEDRLYFSDTQKGGVYRRDPSGDIETVVPKRRGVGGIALHTDGGVIVTGRNVCHVKDGATRVLFGADDIPGFNDLTTDSLGRILVGSLRSHAFSPDTPGDCGELYRIAPAGEVTMLYDDVALSNGIGISPDGSRLYHSDSTRSRVLVHVLEGDGSCTHRRIFAETSRGVPDGLAVDAEGYVWVAAYGGGCVMRFAPDGRLDRHLDVPARMVTSLCFGGSDRRDLYVVTADNGNDPALAGSIFRTRSEVPGLPIALARV